MRRCHSTRLLALLFATLALWPLSVAAQETCVGDQCNPPGSIYRTITDMALSGRISAGVVLNASSIKYAIVNTLSDLRDAPVPNDNSNTVFVAERLGFSVAGDGGRAIYVLSQTSSCTDDGGGCVKPARGLGRWVLVPTYPLNKMIWGISGALTFYACKQADSVNCSKAGDASASNYCVVKATPCLTIAQLVKSYYQFPWYGSSELGSVGGGSWVETVSVSSPLITAPGITGTGFPALYLKGAGSGSTTITGSGSECGTIISSFGGSVINVQAMTLTGVANACQSTLYAQEGGVINTFADVTLGAANQQQLHAEETGSQISIWGSPAVTGAASSFVGVTNGALVYANPANFAALTGVTITFSGQTYSSDTVLAQHGGRFYLAADTVFAGTTTGRTYVVEDGGGIASDNTAVTPIPGTLRGIVLPGGLVFPEKNLVPNASLNSVGSLAGLGSTGTASVTADNSQNLNVVLSPSGAAPGSTGSFIVTLSSQRQYNGGNTVACTASFGNQTGTWDTGATLQVNPGTNVSPNPTVQVIWKNAAAALVAGSTYGVGVMCQ